ncbi:MAG: hypothetical protein AAGC93_31710, partial [Cyanobacteria bacterium P01_F01_bin.53]
LGGFVIFEMQKIPKINEQLSYSLSGQASSGQDLVFTVIAAEGPKLTKIQISRLGEDLKLTNASAPVTVRQASHRTSPFTANNNQPLHKKRNPS